MGKIKISLKSKKDQYIELNEAWEQKIPPFNIKYVGPISVQEYQKIRLDVAKNANAGEYVQAEYMEKVLNKYFEVTALPGEEGEGATAEAFDLMEAVLSLNSFIAHVETIRVKNKKK